MDVLSTTSFGYQPWSLRWEGDETMLPLRVQSVGSNSVRGPGGPGGPGDFTGEAMEKWLLNGISH
jgi:hypothetical protein